VQNRYANRITPTAKPPAINHARGVSREASWAMGNLSDLCLEDALGRFGRLRADLGGELHRQLRVLDRHDRRLRSLTFPVASACAALSPLCWVFSSEEIALVSSLPKPPVVDSTAPLGSAPSVTPSAPAAAGALTALSAPAPPSAPLRPPIGGMII